MLFEVLAFSSIPGLTFKQRSKCWFAGISVLDPPKYKVTFHHLPAAEVQQEELKMDIVERQANLVINPSWLLIDHECQWRE